MSKFWKPNHRGGQHDVFQVKPSKKREDVLKLPSYDELANAIDRVNDQSMANDDPRQND